MNNHDLTALAEAVGIIDPDPAEADTVPWNITDARNIALSITIALPTAYTLLVGYMSLGGAA